MDYAERARRRRLAVFLDPKKNYAERPRRTGLAVFWLVFISFGVIVIFGSQQKNLAAPGAQATGRGTVLPDKLPRDQIKIADWQWNGGYSSGLARATFTLHNTTDFAVRDIRVQCVYYGRSGSEINRHDKVIYDHIAPGKKLKTKEIVFGFINEQAVRSDCEVMAHHPTF